MNRQTFIIFSVSVLIHNLGLQETKKLFNLIFIFFTNVLKVPFDIQRNFMTRNVMSSHVKEIYLVLCI